MMRGAQRWRSSTWRAASAWRRMAGFQSSPGGHSSISPTTTSTTPSSRSSLLRTWLYSDMASTPSVWASLRMLRAPMPPLSASSTAAWRTRWRVSGAGMLPHSLTYAVSRQRLTDLRRRSRLTTYAYIVRRLTLLQPSLTLVASPPLAHAKKRERTHRRSPAPGPAPGRRAGPGEPGSTATGAGQRSTAAGEFAFLGWLLVKGARP